MKIINSLNFDIAAGSAVLALSLLNKASPSSLTSKLLIGGQAFVTAVIVERLAYQRFVKEERDSYKPFSFANLMEATWGAFFYAGQMRILCSKEKNVWMTELRLFTTLLVAGHAADAIKPILQKPLGLTRDSQLIGRASWLFIGIREIALRALSFTLSTPLLKSMDIIMLSTGDVRGPIHQLFSFCLADIDPQIYPTQEEFEKAKQRRAQSLPRWKAYCYYKFISALAIRILEQVAFARGGATAVIAQHFLFMFSRHCLA